MFVEFETAPNGKAVMVNLDNVKWIEANDAEVTDLVFEIKENGPVSLLVKGSMSDVAKKIRHAKALSSPPDRVAVSEFSVG